MGLGVTVESRELIQCALGSVSSKHKAIKTQKSFVRYSRRIVRIHLKGFRMLLQIILSGNVPFLVLLPVLQGCPVLAPVSLERALNYYL